jgi:acyl carrier protein
MSDIAAERTRTIVAEQLVIDPDEVVDSASFMEGLGADSLDMVELALKFEREFGFEISDDAAESILTVGDAVKFLEKNAVTPNRKGDICAAEAARKNA